MADDDPHRDRHADRATRGTCGGTPMDALAVTTVSTLKDVQPRFGFTPERVVEAVRAQLG